MSVSAFEFANWIDSLATGLCNPHTDDFEILLLDSLTLGTLQTDAQFVADVVSEGTETSTSGTGYSRQTLTSVVFGFNTGLWTLNADDPAWTAATMAPAFALIFCHKTSDADSPVLALYDLGGAQSVTADDFTLPLNAAGIWTYDPAA